MSKAVLFLGFTLFLLANGTNGNLAYIGQVATSSKLPGSVIDGQRKLLMMAGEIIFIVILATLSDDSDEFGALSMAVLVVLGMIWAMNNQPNLGKLVSNLQGK